MTFDLVMLYAGDGARYLMSKRLDWPMVPRVGDSVDAAVGVSNVKRVHFECSGRPVVILEDFVDDTKGRLVSDEFLRENGWQWAVPFQYKCGKGE